MFTLPRFDIAATLLACALLSAGCEGETRPDAQGNFEVDEVTVSSERQGQLVRFHVDEGDQLHARPVGEPSSLETLRRSTRPSGRSVVGLVDTTSLALQRRELQARRKALRARMASVSAEIDVLSEQLRAARRELERMRTLYDGDAAPERQVDQAEDEVRVLQRRVEATRTRKANLADEAEAMTERIAQVNERIRTSWIDNPVAGTVLASYAERGEVVRPGEPLYTIASLDTLTLRAYVSGAQLSEVTIGQQAQVFVDDGEDSRREYPGRVTWVASEAEFTPTPIQTKEERVDFVYAVKIRVPNPEGTIKAGMPGDVQFGSAGNGATTSADPPAPR
jgi:HlyD family secretion protein